jgi:DNA helicase-2/ATP-dependent DNA helicase PcrA
MKFEPSKYQKAIFKAVQATNDNIVIDAVAGSGKTTTIEEIPKILSPDLDVAFVAFNKHIAETLKSRVPKNTHAMTLHSMGLKSIVSTLGKKKVNQSKMFQIVKDMNEEVYFRYSFEQKRKATGIVMKMVSLLKGSLLEPTEENIDGMANHHSIELPADVPIYEMIETAMRKSESTIVGIDYDDMIWMPSKLKLECKKYDVIIVDETQDLNPAQVELVMKSLKKGGRVIAVGDPFQSLYGFRGADTEAMPKLIKRLNAKVMPLSISYRCPKSHVALAQTIVPQIEAAENAPEGQIINIKEEDLCDVVSPNDLCICRFNAPLVRPAFDLLRSGIKVCIRGRDIGTGFTKLLKGFGTNNLNEMFQKLDTWYSKECGKADKKGLSTDPIEDKYETIMAFAEMAEARTVSDLIDHIEDIFNDKRAMVTFSSVHRAKGLEADNVFIIKPSSMPSPRAKKQWEQVQEQNIRYVAFTRAKDTLYMVE